MATKISPSLSCHKLLTKPAMFDNDESLHKLRWHCRISWGVDSYWHWVIHMKWMLGILCSKSHSWQASQSICHDYITTWSGEANLPIHVPTITVLLLSHCTSQKDNSRWLTSCYCSSFKNPTMMARKPYGRFFEKGTKVFLFTTSSFLGQRTSGPCPLHYPAKPFITC